MDNIKLGVRAYSARKKGLYFGAREKADEMIRRHLSRCEGEAKPQCLDSNGGVSLFPSCNLSRQSYFILPQTRNSQDGGAGNSIPLVILSFRNLKVLSVHAHMGLLTPGRALQSTDNLVFLYYDQMH